MKINSINNNLSFQRGMRLIVHPRYEEDFSSHATRMVLGRMWDMSTSYLFYDKKTSAEISTFLHGILNDFCNTNHTGLYLKKIDKKFYLFSGAEAKIARDTDNKAKELIKKAYGTPDYQRINKEYGEKRDKIILDLVEPNTTMTFKLDRKGFAKKITYESYDKDGKLDRRTWKKDFFA